MSQPLQNSPKKDSAQQTPRTDISPPRSRRAEPDLAKIYLREAGSKRTITKAEEFHYTTALRGTRELQIALALLTPHGQATVIEEIAQKSKTNPEKQRQAKQALGKFERTATRTLQSLFQALGGKTERELHKQLSKILGELANKKVLPQRVAVQKLFQELEELQYRLSRSKNLPPQRKPTRKNKEKPLEDQKKARAEARKRFLARLTTLEEKDAAKQDEKRKVVDSIKEHLLAKQQSEPQAKTALALLARCETVITKKNALKDLFSAHITDRIPDLHLETAVERLSRFSKSYHEHASHLINITDEPVFPRLPPEMKPKGGSGRDSPVFLSVFADNSERYLQQAGHMAEQNLLLVVRHARRLSRPLFPFNDCLQEGNLALYRALERFSPWEGNTFATYAERWIIQRIARAVANKARDIRLPVAQIENRTKITEAIRRLTMELEREPTVQEIAKRVNLSPQKVEHTLKATQSPLFLDRALSEDSDNQGTFQDIVPDENSQSSDEHIDRKELRNVLLAVIDSACHTEREKDIFLRRYGFISQTNLPSDKEVTLQQIGHLHDVSRERVRQIEKEIMTRLLKQPDTKRLLRPFLKKG